MKQRRICFVVFLRNKLKFKFKISNVNNKQFVLLPRRNGIKNLYENCEQFISYDCAFVETVGYGIVTDTTFQKMKLQRVCFTSIISFVKLLCNLIRESFLKEIYRHFFFNINIKRISSFLAFMVHLSIKKYCVTYIMCHRSCELIENWNLRGRIKINFLNIREFSIRYRFVDYDK